MPIKQITTQITGMSGINPYFIFIDTDDSIEQIETTGYLNGPSENGEVFNNEQMALVTSTTGISLYKVEKTSTNVSLVPAIDPGNIDFPVFVDRIAKFTDTDGQIGCPVSDVTNLGDIIAGQNGLSGGFTSYPVSEDTGRLILQATPNSDQFDVIITNLSHDQDTIYSIPDCGSNTGNLLNKSLTNFVNGNLIEALGVDGTTIDSGISVSDIQLKSDSNILITSFDSPGSFSWEINARTKYIRVYGWNGGAGGGSGYVGEAAESAGAAGGSAGSCFIAEGPAQFFSSITGGNVGAGGLGGASVPYSSAPSVGNNGQAGDISQFGNFYVPQYVPGGGGGLHNETQTAAAGNRAVSFLGFFAQGGKAGDGNLASGTHGIDAGPLTGNMMLGTGGGGGAGSYEDLAFVGGRGGNLYAGDGATLILAGGAGGQPGPTTIGDGAAGNSAISLSNGFMTGGTGGGGGAGLSAATAGNAGQGGNGGFPGGGGGGGAAGADSPYNINSGAGGNGANGRIIVVEFF